VAPQHTVLLPGEPAAIEWLAQHAERLLSHLLCCRLARALVLRPDPRPSDRVSAVQARADIQAMGSCPGFEATLKATVSRRYVCGPSIEAPVTVAFGSRDLLLLRHQSRHLDELPPTTRTAPLHGCGHVPISDDPAAVVDLIRHSTGR
jgi:pimeloyl-ACP methyl ester carboxylesterase